MKREESDEEDIEIEEMNEEKDIDEGSEEENWIEESKSKGEVEANISHRSRTGSKERKGTMSESVDEKRNPRKRKKENADLDREEGFKYTKSEMDEIERLKAYYAMIDTISLNIVRVPSD